MRTLVISDLHLGNRGQRDVLRLSVPRERLLTELESVDRLVLLGDTVELMNRRPLQSMAVAEPVLRQIGARLGPEREVIVVTGNHDGPLTRRWTLAQGAGLTTGAEVDPHASPALERLLSWLSPAHVRVSYPGVWLGDGIWATHGHYLDRHLVPESAIGIRRRGLRMGDHLAGEGTPIEYEHTRRRRPPRSLPARVLERPAAASLDALARVLHTAAIPYLPRLLRRVGLSPLTAALLDLQMRHSGIPAMADVVQRLGIDAEWVLFGHLHRRGPIQGEQWRNVGGTRFLNTGSWMYEPLLVGHAAPPHGYWPGGAIVLEDGREPRSVGLLDDVGPELLRPGPQSRRRISTEREVT